MNERKSLLRLKARKQEHDAVNAENGSTKLHGRDEWVTIRHLPAFGRATYLRYRPNRYQCQDCEGHPTTSETLEWHDAKSPHSFAYDNPLLLELVNSTVEDVSMKEGISYASRAGVL